MVHRKSSRSIGAMLVAAALLGIVSTGVSAGASVRTQKVLGTKEPAKGTPLRIGLITDDKTASTDNSVETPVAEAAVDWINEYGNGIGGHPIELVRCVSGGDPGKTADCASQMVAAKVPAVV